MEKIHSYVDILINIEEERNPRCDRSDHTAWGDEWEGAWGPERAQHAPVTEDVKGRCSKLNLKCCRVSMSFGNREKHTN